MTRLQEQSQKKAITLYTKWLKTARPKQIAPYKDYFIWLIHAGRGWGKTKTGAQDIAIYAMKHPNVICAVVAPTFGDLRRVCFGGPSGLLSIIPSDCCDTSFGTNGFASANMEIRLANGSKIVGYAAVSPERLRGPQFHIASWQYPEAFDQLMFGLRLGEKPQCLITTTPKPIKILKDLIDRKDVHLTKGNTFENQENLADSALEMMRERYEGTALGRQELYAEILDDVEGALWNNAMIESTRINKEDERELQQIIVAVDPAVTTGENSDETGIMVVGKDRNNEYYVLEDLSGRHTADSWGRIVLNAYYEWEADRIIAEVNNGGDLVEKVIRDKDPNVSYRSVRATRGKMLRAEPIAALYEQKRVHHMGIFADLESQMCSYVGQLKPSPDRLDALVWGITELSKSKGQVNWRIS